ncbi:MAG TPA: drug/metabolite exporter YedA [Chloroflexia bacterium]|nr:drug/metabolite exporter YedA [Chloroflexia bacterium]
MTSNLATDRHVGTATKERATRDVRTENTTAKPNNTVSVVLALLAVYIIWGSTYFAIRITLESFPPFLMAGIRFLLAGGILFTYLKVRGAPMPNLKQWGASTLVGCLLLLGGNGLVTFAEQWVASGLAALAVATMPLFAALFAGLWGRWPRKMEWAGLALGFVGVILLNLEGDMRANPLGAFALLVAAASWALGSVWSHYLPLPGGMMASATEMLGGGAALLVVGLLSGEHMTVFPETGPTLAFFYLVIFGSIVAFSAYSYLLQKVRPTLSTSYAYVNPAVAVALGVWLGGELVTWVGLVAMPVILVGVGIVVLGASREGRASRRS